MSDGLKDVFSTMDALKTSSAGTLSNNSSDNTFIVNTSLNPSLSKEPIVNTYEFRGINGPILSTATKYDGDKVPVELLPSEALEEIAKVLAFGKKKYDAWNWAKGFKWTRLIGAAIRHLYAYKRGEDKDPESGLSHIAHAGCCILFLLQHDLSKLGEDDRYKGFKK